MTIADPVTIGCVAVALVPTWFMLGWLSKRDVGGRATVTISKTVIYWAMCAALIYFIIVALVIITHPVQ